METSSNKLVISIGTNYSVCGMTSILLCKAIRMYFCQLGNFLRHKFG